MFTASLDLTHQLKLCDFLYLELRFDFIVHLLQSTTYGMDSCNK